jgi:hypothetical protein
MHRTLECLVVGIEPDRELIPAALTWAETTDDPDVDLVARYHPLFAQQFHDDLVVTNALDPDLRGCGSIRGRLLWGSLLESGGGDLSVVGGPDCPSKGRRDPVRVIRAFVRVSNASEDLEVITDEALPLLIARVAWIGRIAAVRQYEVDVG